MRFVKVELEVDQTLVDEVMLRYRLHSPRDPFGLAALDPHRARGAG